MGKKRSQSSISRTGGDWDPSAWPVYFVASNASTFEVCHDLLDYILIAVNELEERGETFLKNALAAENKVLVDSGVYWLSTQHARRHRVSMNEALSLGPDEVDGFKELFARYVTICREYGDRVWGYIEIDQGGRENKIKTRARLERMGLKPIPVYHPFNDGWDYFDYLAERYDRICFGNVVMADAFTRKRLIATAWERRRKYPHLWIHLLGMTPSDLLTAFPINSCDSSTWIGNQRWGRHSSYVGIQRSSDTDGFIYNRSVPKDAPEGWDKAGRLSAYDASMLNRSFLSIRDQQREELGADIGLFE